MREHLPSLVMRASALVHHMCHFYHSLLRMIEVGLLRLQGSPRICDRRAAKQLPPEASSDQKARRPDAKRRRRISAQGNSSSEVSRPEDSSPWREGRGRLENKKLIISIHIPKTGGTTFSEILKTIAEEIFYLDYGNQVFSPTALYRHGQLVQEPFESVTDLELLPGRSVIHGHFRIGKYLKKFPKASYVTWLRDPVERIASQYFYWQRTPLMDDPLCNKVITEKMTLEEFARWEVARNVQRRFLSPTGVESFAFIGITEEYERSLELFRRLICPDVQTSPTMQNYNPDRPAKFYDLEPGLREKILKLNELDAYTYVDGIRRFRCLCDQVGL